MAPLTISNYLGTLQEDPDNQEAVEGLLEVIRSGDPERMGEQPVRLLEVARGRHEARGDLPIVARLIEAEIELIREDPKLEAALWKELGRLRSEDLLEVEPAREAYRKANELNPDDGEVVEALKKLEQAESSWRQFANRFVQEADSAADTSLKTSLLVRAATLVWQFKRKGRAKETDELFKKAMETDPSNAHVVQLYEQTMRARENWRTLAKLLLDAAERVRGREDRCNFFLRAARVLARKLDEPEKAADCYERVLEFLPGNPEAMAFLVERFTEQEQWDRLVAIYEDALKVRQKVDAEQAFLLQIAMVHWRKRGSPDEAETYFSRLRKLDPCHPAMLQFYREYLGESGDLPRLLNILADAQRVTTDAGQKLELAVEMARTAQSSPAMFERSIDSWKLVQRMDPGNAEAAVTLKELYSKTEKWNALVEVLKTELDSLPEDDIERRVALLREQVEVYRDRLKMDVMVINTYNAILKLLPDDRETLDALAEKYEAMERWNDLIQVLTRKAEATEDRPTQVALFLRVASLWVERFANYNQATGPLEKVLELEAENREALVQLKDIYNKKRAWQPLFDVLRREASVASDPSVRLANTVEMARLAGDRLHRNAEAIDLWREVVSLEPGNEAAVEALEKLAERERDWPRLAEALEKRLDLLEDDDSRIKVLQKLGTLYAEQLNDQAASAGAWRRILQIDPKNGRARRTLRETYLEAEDWDGMETLYAEAEDWEALVDVLGGAADKASDPAVKKDLSFRAARIFEQRIGEPQRAFRSYERILSVDPENVEAARALAPIYETEEKWSRLLSVLEIILKSQPAEEQGERLVLLGKLRDLALVRLRDGEAAFRYASDAYALSPRDEGVIEGLEAAAEKAAAYDRLLEIFLARAKEAPADEALGLHRRAVIIADERLGRTEVAVEQLRAVLEAVPDDPTAVAALDRIYRAEKRTADIRDLLVHRLTYTDDSSLRWSILKELADLEENVFTDIESCTKRYREMLEINPTDRDTLVALDRLALQAERWEELADILWRRRDMEKEPAVYLELSARLGALLADRLDDPGGAVDVFAAVIEADPEHGQAVAALEKMADASPELAERINKLLENVYERTGRFDKLLKVLARRLEAAQDEGETRTLRLRLAEISGSKLGDAVGAYGALEAAFLDRPADIDLWDRLAEAAERAGQHRALVNAYATAIEAGDLGESDVADLSARVARVYDEVLAQPDEAEPFHRKVLAHDPLNEASFMALKELFTSLERWEDLQALYRKRIEETVDAGAKLELLLQVCFLFEEILNKPELAIEAYQAVLELEPGHAPSIRTLEKLYERTGRWRDLAALLRHELDQAEGQDAIDLMFRLGEINETKLGEAGNAVDQYEGVLMRQPTHLRAQEALERLLGVESQRQRIAAILEPLYEEQGAYADLARILEVQLEFESTAGGRAGLLLRIAELNENRLREPGPAFEAYARAVEADPSDPRAREELARISETRESYRRKRVDVLEKAVEVSEHSASLQSELLLELAQLLDERLGDTNAAERVYERLIEVDADNPEVVLTASRALERIHLGKGDHTHLAEDLRRQIAFESDDQVRRELLVRLGDLLEEVLGDVKGAVETHRQRLELDPADLGAMRALERIYQHTEEWQELISVLQRRDAVEDDESERRQIALRIGSIYEEKLEDSENAIAAFNEVVTAYGPDPEALAALGRLYEAGERWVDLLETVQMRIDQSTDPTERAELKYRAADLMRTRTGEVEEAIRSYEEVLIEIPDHAGSLADLEAIMSEAESPYRIEAARVAQPRHEAAAAYDKLLGVLEVLADTDDPQDRLSALRRAAEVAELGINDPSRAFAYMGRAVRAGLSDPDLQALLQQYERFADESGRWGEFLATLQEIAPNIYDGVLQPEVYRKVAEVARTQFNDVKLACEYYRLLVEVMPEDAGALDALEVLNAELGDYPALIDVLRRKVELTAEPEERKRLYRKQAEVFESRLEDASAAIDALEAINAEEHDERAYESLERLYAAEERWFDLSALYEQKLDRGEGDAVELRYKLGKNLLEHLDDPYQALEQLRSALVESPDHEPTVELLESLLNTGGEHKAVVAEILEPGYLARMQWPKLTAVLEARIEMETDLDERKRLLIRLGQIHEDQLEDFGNALEVYGRLFREDPRDEDVWETLVRLAKVAERWERLADIFAEGLEETQVVDEITARLAMQTGRLFHERTGDLEKATKFYSEALAFDQTDPAAFEALESVYRRTESWQSLLELYRMRADVAETDKGRSELLHKRARLFRETLNDTASAVDSYREILEGDPANAEAMQEMDDLLVQTEQWEALEQHLRHRIDQSLGTPAEIDFKYRLAELLAVKLDDRVSALDVYEEITQIEPSHQPTIGALEVLVQDVDNRLRITQILEPIYRQLDQWKKLIAIFEAQVELVDDPIERVRLLREIAELHETRGGDAQLAFHGWSRAFVTEPSNEEVMANLDRLAAAMESWDDHVAAYEAALKNADDRMVVTTLLSTIARVHDEKRGDPRSAIETYERLLQHDPDDPSPFDSLEALHTMVGDWRGLVDVLERRVERLYEPGERGELLRRIGSVMEELLGDRVGAVHAYKRAFGEDDTDVVSLEALDRLYTAASDAVALSEVLRRRIELCDIPLERAELSLRLGQIFEEHLRQPEDAIEAFQSVLEDQPGDRVAVESLARLYTRQAMWPELLDNLKLRAGMASSDEERVQHWQRAGEVLERELDDVFEAITMYRDALSISPDFGPAIDALLRIANIESYRAQAAEIVEPLLRVQERWDDLAQLMGRTVDALTDPFERRDELKRLAEVHEVGRHNAADAFEALCRALGEDTSDAGTIEELERLAEVLGAWERLSDVFGARASSAAYPADAVALYHRLARIAEEKLGDDARAIEALIRVGENDEDPNVTLPDLDRLYQKTEQWDELTGVLQRRLDVAGDPGERIDFQVRLAELREQHFNDLRGAFAAYQDVLENDPREPRALAGLERIASDDELAPEVVEILEAAYRQAGSMDKVAGLYDIKVKLARSDGERARLLRDAAAVWEQDLGDLQQAVTALRRAFELDPREEELLVDLERLAGAANAWEGMRGLVEGLTASGVLDAELKRDLNLRAAGWYRDQLADAQAAETCLRAAVETAPEYGEAHAQLVELLRVSGRESELIAALRSWANVEGDEFERKERLREAARLAEGVSGDLVAAAECLEAILSVDGADPEALDDLARIRSEQKRWEEVVELLERRIEVETDPQGRTELRRRIAALYQGPLEQNDKAIETYRQLLDEEPGERRTLDALESLYETGERWEDLSDLLDIRLQQAETSQERIAVRVRLARLAEQKFGKSDLAIGQLRDILAEDSGNLEALDELERLYAAGALWEDLSGLLKGRAETAAGAGDTATEIAVLLRLGEVYEQRLQDKARAIETYGRVVERDPGNVGALNALAALHQQAGDWEQTVAVLERLFALLQGEEAVALAYRIADLATEKLSDPARTEAALRNALAADASSSETRARLKAHYEKHEQFDRLVEVLALEEQAAEDPSVKVELLRRIAELHHHKLDDAAGAVGYLERAVQLVPDDRSALLPLCDLYIAAGRQADAVPVLQRIIDSYGTRRAKEVAVYQHRLGQALEGMGNLEEALQHYDAAFKIDLTNVHILRDLGRICLQRGDLDRAQKTYRALLLQKLGPDSGIRKADIYFHLGDIAARQGEKSKAKSMLERAISEAGEHEQARQLLESL